MTAIGETLRAARLARNVSLEQVAQETRISLRFLEALEDEDFKVLPAPVYVRGFLRSYANYLGVDPQPLVDELQLMEGGGAPPARSADPFQPSRGVHPLPTSVIVESDERSAGNEPFEEEAYEEWEPEGPDDWDEGVVSYPAQNLPRRGGGVSGVLNERSADTSGITRVAMLVAGGAIIVVVVLVVLLLFTGGEGNQVAAPLATETPTATLAAGTVIEVGSPAVTTTAAAGTDGTPTPDGANTAAPGETATATTDEPTATAVTSGGNPTVAPVQPTATTTATGTPTTAPQATATFTPMPTATPTVIWHPYQFQECPDYTCGNPVLVVCAPNGWFVDVPPYGNWPGEWPRVEVLTSGQATTACQ